MDEYCAPAELLVSSCQNPRLKDKLCKTKLLVTQERYVWDRGNNRPSELLALLRENFPMLRIVVMPDAEKFNYDKPISCKGRREFYCWNTLKKFVEPYHHVVHRNLE